MTIDKIRDEKLEYDIIRETLKISALPSGKIGKYKNLTGEENTAFWIEDRMIEQSKFTDYALWKTFEKQTKTFGN